MSLVAGTVVVVGAGSRTRVEAALSEDVEPEVAAVLDPLVVLLGEHSADEAVSGRHCRGRCRRRRRGSGSRGCAVLGNQICASLSVTASSTRSSWAWTEVASVTCSPRISQRPSALAPEGSWAASAGNDGKVQIWDPSTGATRHTLTGHSGEVWA